ncbi:hypothetical protein TorRG33x02_120220 [Trema orientale]|uniref:Uncharacterized protein n=1 Tax=Trema orientale TaxID=63057 RepID=A0A2P5F326_TREOI|nr:hypothetical protein TorRG33x02_120220 [Trema orientale]
MSVEEEKQKRVVRMLECFDMRPAYASASRSSAPPKKSVATLYNDVFMRREDKNLRRFPRSTRTPTEQGALSRTFLLRWRSE